MHLVLPAVARLAVVGAEMDAEDVSVKMDETFESVNATVKIDEAAESTGNTSAQWVAKHC